MFRISDFDKETETVYKIISNASATGTLISEKDIQNDTSHRVDTEPILKRLLEESYIHKVFIGFKTMYFLNNSEFIASIIENVKSQYSDSNNFKASLTELQKAHKNSLSFVTRTKDEVERFEKQLKSYLIKETNDFIKNPDEKKALSLTHPFLKGTHNHIIIEELFLNKESPILKIKTNYNTYYFDEKIIFENLDALKENIKLVSERVENSSATLEIENIYKEIVVANHSRTYLNPDPLITLEPEEREITKEEALADKKSGESLNNMLSALDISKENYSNVSSDGKFFIETLHKISSPIFFKKVAPIVYSYETRLKESPEDASTPSLILINLFYLFRISFDAQKKDLLFDLVKKIINIYAVKDYFIMKLYREMESSLLGELEEGITGNKNRSQEEVEKTTEANSSENEPKEKKTNPPIDEIPNDDLRDVMPDPSHEGLDIIPEEENSRQNPQKENKAF